MAVKCLTPGLLHNGSPTGAQKVKLLVSTGFTDLYASDTEMLQQWTHTILIQLRPPTMGAVEHSTLMDLFQNIFTLFLGNWKIWKWRRLSKASLPSVTPKFQLKAQNHYTSFNYFFLHIIIAQFLPAEYMQIPVQRGTKKNSIVANNKGNFFFFQKDFLHRKGCQTL